MLRRPNLVFTKHVLLLTSGVRDGPSLTVVTGHKQSSDTTAVKSELVFVKVSSVGQIRSIG